MIMDKTCVSSTGLHLDKRKACILSQVNSWHSTSAKSWSEATQNFLKDERNFSFLCAYYFALDQLWGDYQLQFLL